MPYFQFYPKDWLCDAKVRIMTHEQRGMYFDLLCYAWQEEPAGTLPNDDTKLARLLNISEEAWQENKPFVLDAFSIDDDGRLNQKRMRSEFDAACQSHDAQVEGGRKGGLSQAQGRLKLTSSQAQGWLKPSLSLPQAKLKLTSSQAQGWIKPSLSLPQAKLKHSDSDADSIAEAKPRAHAHTHARDPGRINGADVPASEASKLLLDLSEASIEELEAEHPLLPVRALIPEAQKKCTKRYPKGGPMKLPFFKKFLEREEKNLNPPGLIEAKKEKAEQLAEAARDREQLRVASEEEGKAIAESLRQFRKQTKS